MIQDELHFLYMLKSNEDKCYIGVTKQPKKRLRAHLGGYGSKLVFDAVNRGCKFEEIILSDGSFREVYDLEPSKIKEYNSLAPNGYNLGIGGEYGGSDNRVGSRNTQAILNEDLVLEIRTLYAEGLNTQLELANIHKVSRETISALVRGNSWSNVGGPLTFKRHQDIKTPQDTIDLIQFLRKEDGLPYKQIALETGVTLSVAQKYGRLA